MKRVVLAAVAVLSLFVFAPQASATDDDPPACERVVDVVEGERVAEVFRPEGRCLPEPGTPCRRDGQPGVFDRFGRCICTPPTTVPPTTTPPPPGPPGPAGPQGPPGETVVQVVEVPTVVEVPVERVVVVEQQARPAVARRSVPTFTG